MVIQKFEDLIAWQKSQDLAVKIYSVFGELKDYSFKNQIKKSDNKIPKYLTKICVIKI